MRIDNLVQFIVPLTFLAIWALTSLFNREVQSLPPRVARPQGPTGPTPREFDSRQPSLGPDGRPGGPRGRPTSDDEIRVISQETRRPSGGPNPVRVGSPTIKRASKTRPTTRQVKRTPEAATPRALSASITPGMSSPSNPTNSLKKLTLTHDLGLSPASTEAAAADSEGRSKEVMAPRPMAENIRLLLNEPSRLRDSFIAGEVLFRPPLAVRNGPFRFRGFRKN